MQCDLKTGRRLGITGLSLAAVVTLVAGCAHGPVQPGLLDSSDTSTHCKRLWPASEDSYRLCQQLQIKNRASLTAFANARGINGDNLETKANGGDQTAQLIQGCLSRWRPDYTSAWRCVQDKQGQASS